MMGEETEYRSPTAGPELDRVRQILTQAFSFPEKAWESYVRRIGAENFRIQRREDRVAGALAILRFAHVVGGRAVPTGGIAAVGVPPEERRGGVALRLMQNTLRELRAEGLAASSLFPATITLYRKAGYELAGANVRYRVRIPAIPIRSSELPLHRVPPEPSSAIEELCMARAASSSGHLVRSKALWERLTDPRDKELFAYLIGARERPEGFVIYHQESAPGGYDLIVRDMVAVTEAAVRRLWSFFAGHATQGRYLQWTGPAVEPLFYVLPEFQPEVVGYEPWMLRILDPVRALEARGYPAGLAATIHLRLDDDLFPENAGPFVLEVEGGRGSVRPGGRGELAMDIRILASLYTGFLHPAQLRTVAQIDGKPEVLAAAASVFQAPEPWMADYF